MNNNILMLIAVVTILSAPIIIGIAYGSNNEQTWSEKVKNCTDIYQNEYDLDGYYACWAELDKGLEGHE